MVFLILSAGIVNAYTATLTMSNSNNYDELGAGSNAITIGYEVTNLTFYHVYDETNNPGGDLDPETIEQISFELDVSGSPTLFVGIDTTGDESANDWWSCAFDAGTIWICDLTANPTDGVRNDDYAYLYSNFQNIILVIGDDIQP